MSAQWSFLPRTRYITTGGEGGKVTTDDEALCRGCGRSRTTARVQAVYQRQHPPGFRWLHESFGTKLAADRDAGRDRAPSAPENGAVSAARERNATIIHGALAPSAAPTARCARRRSPTTPATATARGTLLQTLRPMSPENLAPGWTRDRIVNEIVAQGVPCYQGSCSEVYLERAFEGTPWRPRNVLPAAP